MQGCSIIIPAYNEEQNIKKVITELKVALDRMEREYEIIVIDDGSTDNTPRVCKDLNIRLIKHPENAGYGKAIKTGMINARCEIIAVIDADCTYEARDLANLLKYIDNYDMVIGVRQKMHIWDSFWKYMARKVYLLLVNYVTGAKVPDANSGLRVFKKSLVMPFYFRLCPGFSFTTTLTLAMICRGCFVKFVPIEYKKRKGKSKVRWLRDTLATAQILFQVVMYYNPIKAILPFSILCFLLSLASAAVYLFDKGQVFCIIFALMLIASILIFISGLIADLIAQGIRKDS